MTSTGQPIAPHAQQRLETFFSRSAAPGSGVRRVRQSIRSWQDELLGYLDEPTTNGYAEGVINKGQGDQAPRLRTPHVRSIPQTRRHSLWLTGQHDATPLNAVDGLRRFARHAQPLTRTVER